MELFGEARGPGNYALKHGPLNRGTGVRSFRWLHAYGAQFLHFVTLRVTFRFVVNVVQASGNRLAHLLHAWRIGKLLAHQALRIDHSDRWMIANLAVKQWLRVTRIVGLVVAVAAIAHHVDDDVLLELLPVIVGELRGAHTRLRIVPIHMQNRSLHHARNIGRIGGRPRGLRIGRKPDLVIDDQVNRAAGSITFQLREIERLRYYALAGERRVP